MLIHQQTVPNKKQTFDLTAVKGSFQRLLDPLGEMLDNCHSSGFTAFFMQEGPIRIYLELAKMMEAELLIQWKLLQEEGMEALAIYQRTWLNHELRRTEGFFALWVHLLQSLWKSPIRLGLASDPWKSYLLSLVTEARFSQPWMATEEGHQNLLSALQKIYQVELHHQALSFLNLIELGTKKRPNLMALGSFDSSKNKNLLQLAAKFKKAKDWAKKAPQLQEFWEKESGGDLSLYSYFKVSLGQGATQLRPIAPEEEGGFSQLFGIEEQTKALKENIDLLVAKKPALNCLLWGSRGTGKSSSVRALIPEYQNQGLKLIELEQRQIASLPEILAELGGYPESFLLFLDDLSFDANSPDYKHLKSVLDGNLQGVAQNVILIATANRKDIVYHDYLDLRMPANRQLSDEQRALDDRFGLKLYYDHPRFKDLESLLWFYADQKLKKYNKEEILKEFRQFALENNHDAPSGRTVAYFFQQR